MVTRRTVTIQVRMRPEDAELVREEARRRRCTLGELLLSALAVPPVVPPGGAGGAVAVPDDAGETVARLAEVTARLVDLGARLAAVEARLPAAPPVERRSAERRSPPRAVAVADDDTEPPGAAALRAWKERERLTVTTMAARLGMPRGTVGGWLRGILPAPAARPTVEAVTGIPAAAWDES